MDVRCAGCGTEYEFEDALLSERGTTVRCTQCSHQFKVYPPRQAGAEPEEWIVATALGRRVVYRTLRELQNGISHGEVGREDLLTRGKRLPRPLGSIAELEPFFTSSGGPRRQPSTLTGVAPAQSLPPPTHPGYFGGGSPLEPGVSAAAAQRRRDEHDTLSGVAPPANPPREHDTFSGVAPPANLPAAGGRGQVAVPRRNTSGLPAAPSPSVVPASPQARASTSGAAPGQVRLGRIGLSRTVMGLGSPAAQPRSVQPPPATSAVAREPLVSEPPQTTPYVPVAARAGAASDPLTPRLDGPDDLQDLKTWPHPSADHQPLPDIVQEAPAPPLRGAAAPLAPRPASAVLRAEGRPIDAPPSSPDSRQAPDSAGYPQSSQGQRRARPETAGTETLVSEPSPLFVPSVSDPFDSQALEQLDLTQPAARLSAGGALASFASNPPDARPTAPPARRPRKTGVWAYLLTGVALAGAVALYYRTQPAKPSAPAVSSPGNRGLLERARNACDQGDLSLAHELLATRSDCAQPECGPLRARVALGLADLAELALRIAPPENTGRQAALLTERAQRVAEAKRELTEALAQGPATPELKLAEVDLERLSGNLDGASSKLAALSGLASADAETTRALLALSRPNPEWPRIIEHLGRARATDAGLGRAPVALVLAFIGAGRLEAARAELARLESAGHRHSLLSELTAYLRRIEAQPSAPSVANAARVGAGGAQSVDSLSADDASLVDVTREGDFRFRLRRAAESVAHGELTRAEKLYRSVVAERAADTEALAGLGDVARRRGDVSGAAQLYDKVLTLNPGYLPALSARADLQWMAGDRSGALARYRRIVEMVGDSSGIGLAAANRIREAENSNIPREPAGTIPHTDTPATPPSKPAPKSEIDTTDLPEARQ